MAMVGDALGALIVTNLKAAGLVPNPADPTIDAIWKNIANTIVLYIQTNAQVPVNVISVTGVLTGPAVSGPGTGTGTVV